jgi:hypothetical protein
MIGKVGRDIAKAATRPRKRVWTRLERAECAASPLDPTLQVFLIFGNLAFTFSLAACEQLRVQQKFQGSNAIYRIVIGKGCYSYPKLSVGGKHLLESVTGHFMMYICVLVLVPCLPGRWFHTALD